MKDASKIFFEKYFKSSNRFVVVTMKNGIARNGIFISFFYGNEYSNDPYIIKWRFIETEHFAKNKIVDWDIDAGIIMNHIEIKSVKFKNNDETIFE